VFTEVGADEDTEEATGAGATVTGVWFLLPRVDGTRFPEIAFSTNDFAEASFAAASFSTRAFIPGLFLATVAVLGGIKVSRERWETGEGQQRTSAQLYTHHLPKRLP
jgi:hypothetical protein